MFIVKLLWYFVIFSFVGCIANGMRTLFTEKKFRNRGFLTSPFCPTYGLCVVLCYLVTLCIDNKFLMFLAIMLVLSLSVVLVGFLTEKLLKFKPWDFSKAKLKIGNYLTLPYALFLGVVGYCASVIIIPVLDTALVHIPSTVSLILVTSFCSIILADFVLSMITTVKLLKKLKSLEDVETLLKKGVTQEQVEGLVENYNRIFTQNILRKRLASAYPDLKTTVYMKNLSDKLEEIKEDNMKEYTMVFETEQEKPFAFGLCFTKLFYLFVIGSFIGTVLETIWAFGVEGRFAVRVGLVYGPFIPVYGGGACFLTIVLYKLYKLSDTFIFVISAVVGGAFEYFCSWLQELMFGTVSWDYSNTPFNFNGRTNLMYALIWGFLGLVWVRYLYPWAAKLIEKMPKKAGAIITTFLIAFMSFNAFISISATYRWNERADNIEPSNSFAVYLDKHFDDEKMEFLFPNMVSVDEIDREAKSQK